MFANFTLIFSGLPKKRKIMGHSRIKIIRIVQSAEGLTGIESGQTLPTICTANSNSNSRHNNMGEEILLFFWINIHSLSRQSMLCVGPVWIIAGHPAVTTYCYSPSLLHIPTALRYSSFMANLSVCLSFTGYFSRVGSFYQTNSCVVLSKIIQIRKGNQNFLLETEAKRDKKPRSWGRN